MSISRLTPGRPRSIRGLRRFALIVFAGLVLAGCGNERQEPPDVTTPGPPIGTIPKTVAGIRLLVPNGWLINEPGEGTQVMTISTGEATIAIYRYPRNEQIPKTRKQLTQALDLLIGAAKARDSTFSLIKRARLRVDGHPAVQVRGTETIVGRPRVVRSTHVYIPKAEIVIDAFAPAKDFKRVDEQVFRPLLRSVRIAK